MLLKRLYHILKEKGCLYKIKMRILQYCWWHFVLYIHNSGSKWDTSSPSPRNRLRENCSRGQKDCKSPQERKKLRKQCLVNGAGLHLRIPRDHDIMHRDCTCLSLIQPQLWENNWTQAHISNPDVKLVFPNAVSLVTQTTLNIRPYAQHWMATQNKLNGIFVDYCHIILQQNLFSPKLLFSFTF